MVKIKKIHMKGGVIVARQKNITIQMHKKIDSLLKIGESKHLAKQAYKQYCEENNIKWNPSKSPFIHSTGTADAYRQTIGEFSLWLKQEKPDIWNTKDLSQIDKNVAYEYLKYREINGCSAWSISKDMSAINKVLDLALNKKEGHLQERSLKNISRSREEKVHDHKYNAINYKDQIEFAKAFGVRRESILGGQFQVKESSLFKSNGQVYVSVIEKGGRYREAPCLKSYQEAIEQKYNIQERDSYTKEQFIKEYFTSNSNNLFDSYTAKIDNHSFRAEYATNLYKELSEQKENIANDYKNYDSSLLRQVTEALGHSRLNVVVDHYLRN